MLTNSEMVKRVAARSIKAEQQQQQETDGGQQGQQQQQALPQSGPGKMILKKALGDLEKAIDEDDDLGFDKAISNLTRAKGSRPNRT